MNAPEPAPPGTPLPSDSSVAGSRFASAEPPVVPDYELIRRIGGGSYGEVWLARSATGVLRALKIVHRSTFEDDRPFQREFEGIRRFERISREHPGQLALFHIGRNEAAGYFYYVMELADVASADSNQCSVDQYSVSHAAPAGPITANQLNTDSLITEYSPHTLRADLEQGRLPAAHVLEVGLALAEALAHLHSHGLVHRDVKPSNVIFVNGRPKLADIGLVTDASDQCSMVGTEGYLPPDGPGTPQADIFALGKVLYEALTGQDRRKFPELSEEIHAWPDAKLAFELNEVILKACEADRRECYKRAEEMHADLALLQSGQSVKRKRAVTRRWVLARKVVLSLAAVAGFAVGAWALSTKLAWRNPDATRARLAVKKAPSPEVLRLCKLGEEAKMKGTKESHTEAFELFNRAIVLDPGHVPAYLGLASAYSMAADWLLPSRQALPEVKRAATSALRINPSSVHALQWLAVFKMSYEWDWAGAEADLRRAIELGPTAAWPYAFYATLLLNLKRLPEARLKQERALALAPNDPGVLAGMVTVLFAERRFEEALELALKGRREHTNTFAFPIWLAWIYEQKGMYPQAIAELHAVRAIDDGPDLVAFLGYMYAASGDKERARELLKELKGMSGRLVPQYFVALIHVGLGDSDAAIGCLQKAVAENSASLSGSGVSLPIAIDPHFDSLRSDERFIALLRQMGLEK